VAQLAGIPEKVTRLANEILEKLELQGTLQESMLDEMGSEIPSLFDRKEKSDYLGLKQEIESMRKLRDELMSIDVESTPPLEISLRLQGMQKKLKNG